MAVVSDIFLRLAATVAAWLTTDRVVSGAGAIVVLLGGWFAARIAATLVAGVAAPRTSPQTAMIARRAVYYGILLLTIASAMREVGFDLSVLLGAAGVLTVAIGFASQTSASNLISGLFLLGERPFVVGDTIQLGGTTGGTIGVVVSIDLLSVKLRTFDNLLVRIPNETLLKSEITNHTHYPIRRVDLRLQLAYATDLDHARAVLLEAASAHPLCLDEPSPMVLFLEFAESAMVVELRTWAATDNILAVTNTLPDRVKAALDGAGIVIPYPQRTVWVRGEAAP